MKILHIAQSAGYGVTIYLESLIKGLKNKEYEQVILGSEYYNTEHFRAIADQVITVPMCRNISPHDIQTILQCMKIVRKVRPEIVYCHSAKAGIYGRIACLRTKTKVVYNPNGWSFYVKELVRFMLYRLEHHEHGVELYNCCFEPAYTIQHIVEAMKKVTGLTQFVHDIPNWVIMPMAKAAMLLGSPMGICPARVKKLQISTNICGKKLAGCGYKFKWSFEEALEDWFNDNGRKGLL